MPPYFQNALVTLYYGDSREILPTLSGATAVVTDPPYHLTQASRNGSCRNNDPATPFGRHKIGEKGFMGKTWDGGGISFDPALWKLCLDVCLPGAYLMAFGGCRTYHRIVCAIEDAGWAPFQMLQWIFGSGFPKSRAIGKAIDEEAGIEREVIADGAFASRRPRADHDKQGLTFADDSYVRPAGHKITAPASDAAKVWEGYGTDIKPAHEPICLARKPLDGTYAQNALKHGCGGLNIDECRVGTEGRTLIESIAKPPGELCGEFRIGSKSLGVTSQGRWPANIIHDGSEEVVQGFPETGNNGDHIRHCEADNKIYGHGKPRTGIGHADSGSAARFFYCAKASGDERDDNTHATVKPLALMEYLCRLIKQPERNLVLDPFAGSGSTLLACEMLGIPAIGIEADEGHCEIIAKRFSKPAQPFLL